MECQNYSLIKYYSQRFDQSERKEFKENKRSTNTNYGCIFKFFKLKTTQLYYWKTKKERRKCQRIIISSKKSVNRKVLKRKLEDYIYKACEVLEGFMFHVKFILIINRGIQVSYNNHI